jgi:phospholipid/cholesterol/gamma-HCH transport system ATP-binding protein
MIEIKNLAKNFPGRDVLRDLSCRIEDGDTFSVIGPSGTGKSTFIKCIMRLLKPDAGHILVDGEDIAALDDEFEIARIRRNFGYLFQEGALFDSLTVFENVSFGLRYLTDIPREDYPRIVAEKLSLVGLDKVEHLKPAELSVGMKKRVALARAVAAGPKCILYDEPTTGLDPVTTEMVTDLIVSASEKLKVTSILVTHDVNLALRISTQVAMLDKGVFAAVEPPDRFIKSDSPAIKEFLEISNAGHNGCGDHQGRPGHAGYKGPGGRH